MSDTDQLARILQALKSSDPDDRRSGIFASVKAKSQEASPILRSIAGSDNVAELRFLARKALCLLGTPTASPGLSAASSSVEIEVGLASDDPDIRASALRTAATKEDRSLLPYMVKRIHEERNVEVRGVLVLALAQLGGADQFENVVRFLSDSDGRCRANAVEALHSLAVPEAYPHIVRMVQDEDNRVRANALKALGELGKVNVLKCCQTMLLPSQDYWVRDSAAWLLASWKMPEAVPLLEQALKDPYPAVAIKAKKGLEALAAHGVDEAKNVLSRATPIGDTESLEDFLALEKQPQNTRVEFSTKPVAERRRVSGLLLEQEVDDGNLPTILGHLKNETDEETLINLIEALRKTKSPTAIPILRDYLTYESQTIRALAVQATREIGRDDPVDSGAQTFKDESPNERVQAETKPKKKRSALPLVEPPLRQAEIQTPRSTDTRKVPSVQRPSLSSPVLSRTPPPRFGTVGVLISAVFATSVLVLSVGYLVGQKTELQGARSRASGAAKPPTPVSDPKARDPRGDSEPLIDLDCQGLDEGKPLTKAVDLVMCAREESVASLELRVDGKRAASWKAPLPLPATYTLDPTRIGSGKHEIKISASTATGHVWSQTIRFKAEKREVEMEVVSPTPGSKVFGQVNVWVKPRVPSTVGPVQKMEVSVSGGLVVSERIGEARSSPWIVPWSSKEFAQGSYEIKVSLTTTDRVTGTLSIPVEVIKPRFTAEFSSPKSGDIVVDPVTMGVSVSDESGLGVDRVEFAAGGNVLEKKTLPPWTTTLHPSRLAEGLVRLTATAFRKDETKAEAEVTIMVRWLLSVFVPVVASAPSGSIPPAALLGKTPRVTVAGKPPRRARFVSAGQWPAQIVVVYPASKFTEDQGNLQPMLSSLSAFLRRVRPSAAIRVIGYADRVLNATESREGSPEVRVSFVESGRVLYDGIAAGVDALRGDKQRFVLVLLVDGPDSNALRTKGASEHNGPDVIKRVRSRPIEFHVIGFGRDLTMARNLELSLSRLAGDSGGTCRTLTSIAELPTALETVWTHVNSQVLLELVPAVEQQRAGPQALHIDLPGENEVKLTHRTLVTVR